MAQPSVKTDEDEEEEQSDEEEEEEQEEEQEEEVDPEPTTDGGQDEDDEEEEEDLEQVDLPDDDDDVQVDGQTSDSTSFLSGSTFGISNKILLGVGIAAIILVLWLRSQQPSEPRGDAEDIAVVAEDDGEPDGQVQGTPQDPLQAGGSQSRMYDEAAQDHAIEQVFGGG